MPATRISVHSSCHGQERRTWPARRCGPTRRHTPVKATRSATTPSSSQRPLRARPTSNVSAMTAGTNTAGRLDGPRSTQPVSHPPRPALRTGPFAAPARAMRQRLALELRLGSFACALGGTQPARAVIIRKCHAPRSESSPDPMPRSRQPRSRSPRFSVAAVKQRTPTRVQPAPGPLRSRPAASPTCGSAPARKVRGKPATPRYQSSTPRRGLHARRIPRRDARCERTPSPRQPAERRRRHHGRPPGCRRDPRARASVGPAPRRLLPRRARQRLRAVSHHGAAPTQRAAQADTQRGPWPRILPVTRPSTVPHRLRVPTRPDRQPVKRRRSRKAELGPRPFRASANVFVPSKSGTDPEASCQGAPAAVWPRSCGPVGQ